MLENNKLIETAKGLEAKLDKSNLKYNTDLITKGINVINKLLDNNDLDILDVEEDGVNYITDYGNALNLVQEAVRTDIENVPAVNDLSWLYNHDFYDYVYINGYARITAVTNSDVSCELDDIVNYLKDNVTTH